MQLEDHLCSDIHSSLFSWFLILCPFQIVAWRWVKFRWSTQVLLTQPIWCQPLVMKSSRRGKNKYFSRTLLLLKNSLVFSFAFYSYSLLSPDCLAFISLWCDPQNPTLVFFLCPSVPHHVWLFFWIRDGLWSPEFPLRSELPCQMVGLEMENFEMRH